MITGAALQRETAQGMKKDPCGSRLHKPSAARNRRRLRSSLRGRSVPLTMRRGSRRSVSEDTKGCTAAGRTVTPDSEAFNRFFNDTGNYIPPEDAETIPQLYERTGSFLKEISEREDLADKNILVSTHRRSHDVTFEQDPRQSVSGTFLER